MHHLPNTQSTLGKSDDSSSHVSSIPTVSYGSTQKESEGVFMSPQESHALHEIGKEAPLPQEVVSAGVHIKPTSVQLPSIVSQAGVQAVGQQSPHASAQTIVLPLTDDQIASGLQGTVDTSFRWLAEWCLRKLKAIHVTLQITKGHVQRVLFNSS